MKITTLDFETYYSTEYSLRKMSPVEYILDPQFECTGLAVKRGTGKSFWIEGDRVQEFFDNEPEDCMAVSHNALFDMCIAAWRYGWVPRLMTDTLGIARAVLQAQLRSLSLNSVAGHLGLGGKTDALANVKGMRLDQIRQHPDLYRRFIEYGLNDSDLCYGIFNELVIKDKFPMSELLVMNSVLRCAVLPKFTVNTNLLQQSLNTIKTQKEQTLAQAMLMGADGKETLMSNDKFADLLRQLNIDPPMKISGTTGKPAYAFAKSDQDFLDLLEHPDTRVQTVVAARLGHKSTIEETRHERFIRISNLEWPKTKYYPGGYQRLMPMPLRYSGAHTHRLSGDWSLNVQNMGRGSMLRQSLEAPDGYVVVAGDESQVEARFVCTLCGQEDMRQQFDRKEDVYSIFASDLFKFTVTKANKIERFIGKQCLAGDTPVLTDEGWVPIMYVKPKHKLWDGTEWVAHNGLLDQGVREVETSHGLTMTVDHEILTAHGWQAWSEVHTNPSLFQSALDVGNLPSRGGVSINDPMGVRQDGNLFVNAHVGRKQNQIGVTSLLGEQPVVTHVPNSLPGQSDIGSTNTQWQMTPTEQGSSTACHLPLVDAIHQQTMPSLTTEGGVSPSIGSGGKTEAISSNISKLSEAGTTLTLKWTEGMSTRDINPGTSALLPTKVTCKTSAGSLTLRAKSLTSRKKMHVYDLADAGPKNRFTVLSDSGPVIVHNCILGLGYGLGKDKFSKSIPILAWNQLSIKLPYTLEEGTAAVQTYRNKNTAIVAAWKTLNTMGIHTLVNGGEWRWGPVIFRKGEIILPNGMKLFYHNIRQVTTYGKAEWVFDYAGKIKRIYGGMLLENITQALARIITMEAAVRCEQHLAKLGIPLALQVHDELVFVVKKEYEKIVRFVLEHELKRRPKWLLNVPLDCEIGSGPNYGEAK